MDIQVDNTIHLKSTSKGEMEKALAAGVTLPLVPLALGMECTASEGEMNSNFFATLDRGYTPINDFLWKEGGKEVCLVGAGPSLKETHKELIELGHDICAVNSGIKFLVGKNIIPKYAMLWDASEIVKNFVVPHPEITYLVASRCHPEVFERLKDCKVVVWHANGDHNILEIMNRPEVTSRQKVEEPLINGGSAGITRGIYLMANLGYKKIHLFGADASYLDDKTHVMGSLVYEKDIMVSIGNNPPRFFRTTPEFCAQVEEYKSIFTLFVVHCCNELVVHGDGMLPHMHRVMEAKLELQGKEKFIQSMMESVLQDHKLNESASKVCTPEMYRPSTKTQPLEVTDG